jgi:hypothetical protein
MGQDLRTISFLAPFGAWRLLARLAFVNSLLVVAGCSRISRGTAAVGEESPNPPARADATVRRIDERSDVPLRGPYVDARKGDWLVRGRDIVAVVSTSKGTVVDFGAEGGDDALVSIDPSVFIGLDQMTSIVESVAPAGAGGRALLVRKRILSDPALRLWSYVTLVDRALHIESVVTASDQAALAVTLGEVVAWGNVPTWVEGHGFATTKGSLSGDFIAREGLGVAYALATEHGHVMARFAEPLFGFHEWARTGERIETIPAHGMSSRRVVVVTQAHGALGEAMAELPRSTQDALERWPLPAGVPEGTMVEVAHCDGSLFARFDGNARELRLPRGCWRVRLTASGFAPGASFAPDAIAAAPRDLVLPHAGALHWSVRERGLGVVPARILVRGVGSTPDPDWGEDPSEGASLNVIHADHDGQMPIPPGRYHVTVTRGFEYSMRESDVSVVARKTTSVEAELERVVDTRGWISADLHVHALPSPDAPIRLSDRVRALAAAGVEVAVATDHNAITDYGPAIHERGLDRWLVSIPGDEVTTRGVSLGHFNVFPLSPGTPPIPFDHVAPATIVSAARAAPPAGDKVVQLNHPRMGSIGYFELARFDRRDVEGWHVRSPLIETGFDAIEVYNGDDYAKADNIERVMRDWYALLNAGVRITATGNSDSHKLTYHECGVPRNLVRVGEDDPAQFDAARFVDAVRGGRVIVSSGPVARLEVGGRGIGESAPPGDQEIHIIVDAPPWVDVSLVEIVRRGVPLHVWTGPFARGVRRLDARLTATLNKGDWVIAVARGDRPMAFLARPGAKPLSFTNPVWIE